MRGILILIFDPNNLDILGWKLISYIIYIIYIYVEEIFSSATEHAEELEHNIDVILQAQDVRQRHHPGEENRNEEAASLRLR